MDELSNDRMELGAQGDRPLPDKRLVGAAGTPERDVKASCTRCHAQLADASVPCPNCNGPRDDSDG